MLYFTLPYLVQKFLDQGAEFKSRNDLGISSLGAFCIAPKYAQASADVRILDVLHSRNKLGDLDDPVFNTAKSKFPMKAKGMVNVIWRLCALGFFKDAALLQSIYRIAGGSSLHAAVALDKPSVVVWLVKRGASKISRNKSGQTPLELAKIKHFS